VFESIVFVSFSKSGSGRYSQRERERERMLRHLQA
jgi:hypothetical protein